MKHKLTILTALLALANVTGMNAQKTIDLSGDWKFQIDRKGTMKSSDTFTDNIKLPGSMLTRGKGDPVSIKTQWVGSLYDSSYYFNPYMEKYRVEGQMKFPFFLTPDKHYVGTAWYKRAVSIPAAWKKQSVILTLERPHIETTLYINNKEVGHQMGLSAPHVYDVTPYIIPGRENEIAIKVYNGIENVCVGQDSHSVTDQTQGDWNGIVGRMTLDVKPALYISHADVYPNLSQKTVNVVVRANSTDPSQIRKLQKKGLSPTSLLRNLTFSLNNAEVKTIQINDSTYQIALGEDMKTWSEHSPYVYDLTIANGTDKYSTVFGMREIGINGRQLLMNGEPMWVRGTVGNCCFPETGYPPTDVESWTRIFRKCQEYGLNFMRFHSYCPPEAAFTAADRLGFYLQPEGPSWPNHGVKLRSGMYIDKYLMEETQKMVEAYGNHPSFVMMSAGNEPAGNWVAWCNDWVKYWKQTDSRRIYCGANVGGGWAWDDGSQYHVKGGARGLDWDKHIPHSDDDYYQDMEFPRNYKATTPNTDPYISHEQGQWCAFPDLKERDQYTGAYKAKNFDIFADLLRDHGMESQAEKFLHSSGKLQVLAYKYEMERNMRTRDYAGFALLGINDYSGQGTALVGPLNVHWKEKGYVDSREWSEFCDKVVPLAEFPKFTYTDNEILRVPVQLYNASGNTLIGAYATYAITDSKGKEVGKGRLSLADIPVGKNHVLGTIKEELKQFTDAQKLTLTVKVTTAKDSWQNHWDFWVYPSELTIDEYADILITDTLSDKCIETLKAGGKVLLTAAGKVRFGNDVKQTYLPVFWNTSWFKMRPPHTTGAYIDATHPAFRAFPTEDWTNLNWWELVNRAQVMNLAEFPFTYQPPMQPIDTWHVSRKLAMIVEANVLGGKLLMTTMDITSNLTSRIVARQMRKSIVDYMHSEEFQPAISVDLSVIRNLFERESDKVDMFTNDSPDELKPKLQ